MQNLAEIYRKNEYTFTDTTRTSFTIETVPNGVYIAPWAIITAWNPNNEALPKEQNDTQNLKLKKALLVSGHRFIECIGGYDGHFEESFLIEQIGFDEAISMGNSFGQYAIVYHDGKKCGYYLCANKKAIIQR